MRKPPFYFGILFLLGVTASVYAGVTRSTELGTRQLTYRIDWIKPQQAHVVAQSIFPVTIDRAWGVLTDYDHLEEFIPYLSVSKVLQRESKHLLLRQEGGFWVPFYRLKTKVIFWVEEKPQQHVFFKAVEGDFLVYEGSWYLERTIGGTRLTYEVTVEPNFWVPRWVFSEMEHRILKRTFRAILDRCQMKSKGTPESSPVS